MICTTTVKDVQLYRGGCTVHRRGSVHLAAGVTPVIIEGMSSTADPNSFSLHFPDGVNGSGIRLEVESYTKQDDKESDRKAEEIRDIDNELAVLKEQASLYRSLISPEGGELKEKTAYIQEFPSLMAANNARTKELQKKKKQLNEELNELNRKELSPKVHIFLHAEKEGNYPFELQYREPSAYWTPIYEIRSEGEDSPLEFRIRATAVQNTDEDWNGITLSLLTGVPTTGSSVPTLFPQFVNFYEPMHYSYGKSSGRTPRSALFKMDMDMSMEEDAYEDMTLANMSGIGDTTQLSRIVTPEAVVVSDTMTEYKMNGERDFPKGNTGILLDLQTFTLDAEYRIVAVPKLDSKAYLCAAVKTKDLPTMISQEAMVYLKGTYVGTVRISPDLTEESFDVTLGPDDRISVARTVKKRHDAESKLRGTKTRELVYETKITSSRTEPVTILVKDQVPISQDKNIHVDINELSGGTRKEDTGEVVWTLQAAPDEVITKTLAYTVTWPKDKTISGI